MADIKDLETIALNTLKAACVHKKFVSFKDLSPGDYIVNKFSVVNTTYGERIRMDLHDTYMYLPESFLKQVKPELLDALTKRTPKMMTYKGKDANNRNALMLDFNPVDYIDNEIFNYITPHFGYQNN